MRKFTPEYVKSRASLVRKFRKATEGMSFRQVAEETGLSDHSVRKILDGSQLPVQARTLEGINRLMSRVRNGHSAGSPGTGHLRALVAAVVRAYGIDAVLEALVEVEK